MASWHRCGVVFLAINAVLLFGCGGNEKAVNSSRSAETTESNSSRTNVEELGVLVKIPYETLDIVWKEDPASQRILAVMSVSSADANRIVSDSGDAGTPENGIGVQPWFPGELVAQADMSGDSTIKGISYPATGFLQEPYTSGRITRINGTDYFILDVSVK